MGTGGGGEIFYILSGIFNMGVSPISFNGIPRPLYHFTIPFYVIVSWYCTCCRPALVQPTCRWRMSKKQVLVGVGLIVLVAGGIAGAFLGHRATL